MTQDPREKEIRSLRDELIKTREELDHRYQDLNRIHKIVNSIHSTLKLSELSRISKAIIERTLGLKAFSLIVYDNVAKRFIVVETKNLDKKVEQQALELVQQSAQKWEELKKAQKAEVVRIKQDDGTSMIYIPLIAYRRTVGGLCTNEDTIRQADLGGEEMLTLVTSQLSVAMENSILYEITRKLSITDDKTGVFNSRYLKSRLGLEWRRAQRYGRRLSFLMVDLDDFKAYNDTFGHLKGDKVLAEVASILSSVCRDIDVVARYGGEEFAIVLPETGAAGAENLARRIAEKLEDHRFEGAEGRDQRMTVSIGIAAYPHHAETMNAVIQLADQALYEAKRAGKCCYKVAKPGGGSA